MAITPSPTVRDITRSAYVGKDFNTYRQELIDALTAIFGSETASNIVASEQGVMLIEIFAYGLSTLAFYLDREADETKLDIPGGARIRANAVAIARILGYSPFAAVPPVISLTMTINPPYDTLSGGLPARLTLEKGRQLNGPGGLIYELLEEVIFEAAEGGPKTFLAREGVSFNEIFTSDGTPNQRFFLQSFPEGQSVAEATVEFRVAGILWQTVALLTYDQTNQAESNIAQDPPFIRTGDGVGGNIPPVGAEVRVNAFATSGPEGAVASNTVTRFADALIAGTTTVTATLTHNTASTPGSFRETVNSIKTNAPLVFQTAQRAVTISDLDGLINSFVDPTWGAVAKGRATTPRTASDDAALQTHLALIAAGGIGQPIIDSISTYWNKVLSSDCKANVVLAQILAADLDGRYVAAPVGLARALEAFLDTVAESTVKTFAIDGFVNVLATDLTAYVKVLPDFDTPIQSTEIQTQIGTLLQNTLLNRDYGVPLKVSDIYAAIEAVTGVDFVNLEVTRILKNTDDVTAIYTDVYGNLNVGEFEVLSLGVLPVVNILD